MTYAYKLAKVCDLTVAYSMSPILETLLFFFSERVILCVYEGTYIRAYL